MTPKRESAVFVDDISNGIGIAIGIGCSYSNIRLSQVYWSGLSESV